MHVVLTEQTGWNMRNAVAHAMRPADWFDKGKTAVLILLLCQLARFRAVEEENSAEGSDAGG
jgi:hypothetical protein